MMRNRNRWLAAMLSVAIALGDCGGMTAIATENVVTTEDSVSENTMASEEESTDGDSMTEDNIPSSEDGIKKGEENDVLSDASVDDEAKVQLPALHIGQIPEGEALPAADDDTFIYDIPLSFETEEDLILFVNYDLEMTPEYRERTRK